MAGLVGFASCRGWGGGEGGGGGCGGWGGGGGGGGGVKWGVVQSRG